MWESLDPDLKSLIVKAALSAVAFVAVIGGIVARHLIKYVDIVGEAKVQEARDAASRRLARAGELGAASTEEATRGTAIKGEAKAEIAAQVTAELLAVPTRIDDLKPSDAVVQSAVRAGVAKLRASLPAPSFYSLTQSDVPVDVVVDDAKLPAPSRVPALDDRGNRRG